jgi:predicted Rdx family selenoprotein
MESHKEPSITAAYERKMNVLAMRCGSSEELLPKMKEQVYELLASVKNIKNRTVRQDLILWQLRYYAKFIENQELKNKMRDQRILLESHVKDDMLAPSESGNKN